MNYHSNTPPPSWLDLESIHPLARPKQGAGKASVEEITDLSADTLVREHSDKVVRLSARRLGMKLRHALEIAAGKVVAP